MTFKYFYNEWHEVTESLFICYSEQWEERKQSIGNFTTIKDISAIIMKTGTI